MIIECHSCHARFRLDESKIRGKGARVKCRRCGNGIIVLRESPMADPPPETGGNALDPAPIVRDAPGNPRAASPRGPGAPAPDNLIPFPGVARAHAEFFAAGDDAPLSPRAPREKDEVDLAFERLLGPAADPGAPEAVPSSPVEETGVGEEPLPSLTAGSLTPPEATEPVPGGIPPGETFGGPALEFGPGETLELPAPPAKASGPEEAAPTFHGEGGFLLSDSETLDFLKEEHRASEGRPSADISPSLSATPLDKDSPPLRQASPVDAPRAADTEAMEAPESVPSSPVEETGVGEEPLPAPTTGSLTPPEATKPVPGGIPPGETFGGPALEFGPEETLELPPLPAEASGPEEATPTFQREGGFLVSDSETLDFLKEEHRASEGHPRADISLSLSATPLDKDAPSLRQPSPVDAPRAAETADKSALAAAAVEEFPIERNETPKAAVAEVDVPPLRDTPPPAPRIEPRAPASGAPATYRPALSPARIAGVGLAALLLAGVGYLGFTPSGRNTIQSMAPGAAALWGGKPVGEAGSRYDVRNVIGYYDTGADGKRIFVIKGQVTNLSTKEKSGIRIVSAILDNAGKPMAEQVVYAGNVVPGETLRKLDRQAAGKVFANRFGSGLANLNVGSGKSVPFMVVFFDAPETIDSYKVEARDGE